MNVREKIVIIFKEEKNWALTDVFDKYQIKKKNSRENAKELLGGEGKQKTILKNHPSKQKKNVIHALSAELTANHKSK